MIKNKSALTVASILAFAGSASAETISFPATTCIAPNGTPLFHWDGEVANQSTTANLSVNCPMETSSVAPTIKNIKLVFLDRNTSRDNCCDLNAQYVGSDGAVYGWSSGPICTIGHSSAPMERSKPVSIGALGQNVFLQCTLAPRTTTGDSSLFRYEFTR